MVAGRHHRPGQGRAHRAAGRGFGRRPAGHHRSDDRRAPKKDAPMRRCRRWRRHGRHGRHGLLSGEGTPQNNKGPLRAKPGGLSRSPRSAQPPRRASRKALRLGPATPRHHLTDPRYPSRTCPQTLCWRRRGDRCRRRAPYRAAALSMTLRKSLPRSVAGRAPRRKIGSTANSGLLRKQRDRIPSRRRASSSPFSARHFSPNAPLPMVAAAKNSYSSSGPVSDRQAATFVDASRSRARRLYREA